MTPDHPERHSTLFESLDAELGRAERQTPHLLAAQPEGSNTRFGAQRQGRNARRLHRRLLAGGKRVKNLEDASRILGVSRREAAALLSLSTGPSSDGFNPVMMGLARGTTRQVETYAPVPPDAIAFSIPNSPAPGVHARGRRAAAKGPTFGVGPDGHQQILTAYLSAVYGPQEQFGYSVPVGGWITPSILDDDHLARNVGRQAALEHPAAYVAAFARQIIGAVDPACDLRSNLPLVFLDGRRDLATHGIALDNYLNVLIEDPAWSALADIPGPRVKLVEASHPQRTGGTGLNPHLVYHTAGHPSSTYESHQIEAAISGSDAALNEQLSGEWEWLPPIDPELADEESTSVIAFAGFVSDTRTGLRGRLFAFVSFTGAPLTFAVIPYNGDQDPFPVFEDPARYIEAKRDIARCGRLLVGPSQWVGQCRRNAYLYQDYFYVPSKYLWIRENCFAVGSHLRVAHLDFPGALGAAEMPTSV
jgi:hypothetical protein